MDNEFTDARVKNRLADFIVQLEEVSNLFEDASYQEKEKLITRIKNIRDDLVSERTRATKSKNSLTEISFYLPALDEAILFLNKIFDNESNENLQACLYDARFSLQFYLHDTR